MANPDLPSGAVNGSRFIPDADLDWEQPDATVLHVYAGSTVEVRDDDAGRWLDIRYTQAGVDARVAIGTAQANLYAAAYATFMSG